MKDRMRTSLIAACCLVLAGCASLLVLNPYLFAQGVMESQKYAQMCKDLASVKIVVSEQRGLRLPADERQVSLFEPATWHVESAPTGPPWTDRLPAIVLGGNNVAAPVAGTLVITDQSLLFLASEGESGVRIPFPTVFDTHQRFNVKGEPRATVIESCGLRLDVFIILPKDGSRRPDPDANAQAFDQVGARVEADPLRTELRNRIVKEVYGSPFH